MERILIFHANVKVVTYLGMLKYSSALLCGGFTCAAAYLYAVPQIGLEKAAFGKQNPFFRGPFSRPRHYLSVEACSHRPVAFCGLTPFLLIRHITAPFVTHIQLSIPSHMSTTPEVLQRHIRSLPSNAPLTITTMSALGSPRLSRVRVDDLKPAPKHGRRFGMVDYVRDTTEENKARSWYMFRALGVFHVRDQGKGPRRRYESEGPVKSWVWDVVKERIARNGRA